jgi:hypothetical protein
LEEPGTVQFLYFFKIIMPLRGVVESTRLGLVKSTRLMISLDIDDPAGYIGRNLTGAAMADTDRSPLFDSENNQLIHTVKDLPEIGVRIPPEVLEEKGLVVKVYGKLVQLAKGNDGATVILPPRAEMAKICDCGLKQYIAAEYRLHEIGWITIQNLEEPGRTTRRRIVVKCLQMVITDGLRMQEMSEMIKKLIRGTQAGLHKIYLPENNENDGQFPPSLHDLKARCKNVDVNGQSLAQIPDSELFRLSGESSYQEIEIAIMEVETFRPADGKKIFSVAKAFQKRFNKGGRLVQDRKGRLAVIPAGTHQKSVDYIQEADKLQARIYPDETHPPALIDQVCTSANLYQWIERRDFSQSLNALWSSHPHLFTNHAQEGRYICKLSDLARLVRKGPGFWDYTWEKNHQPGEVRWPEQKRTSSPGDTRARGSAIRSIGDALAPPSGN